MSSPSEEWPPPRRPALSNIYSDKSERPARVCDGLEVKGMRKSISGVRNLISAMRKLNLGMRKHISGRRGMTLGMRGVVSTMRKMILTVRKSISGMRNFILTARKSISGMRKMILGMRADVLDPRGDISGAPRTEGSSPLHYSARSNLNAGFVIVEA